MNSFLHTSTYQYALIFILLSNFAIANYILLTANAIEATYHLEHLPDSLKSWPVDPTK